MHLQNHRFSPGLQNFKQLRNGRRSRIQSALQVPEDAADGSAAAQLPEVAVE